MHSNNKGFASLDASVRFLRGGREGGVPADALEKNTTFVLCPTGEVFLCEESLF